MTDAPADDLGPCRECGLPARECTALTLARLSAAEYLEDNAGLSRHAAEVRALELIPDRAKPRPADDLVERLKRAAFTVESLICAEDEMHSVYPDPSAVVETIDEAAARIRSLEAQRDEAVGLAHRLMVFAVHDDDCLTNRFHGAEACSCGASGAMRETRAFLDSLTEKR